MKKVGVSVVIVLLFVCISVALAPAGLVIKHIDPDGIFLYNPSGTIWFGSVETHTGSRYLGHLAWDVAPFSIFTGRLNYDVEYNGNGFEFLCEIGFGWTEQQGSCTGVVRPQASNLILSHYEIDIAGLLTLDQFKVRIRSTGQVIEAGGILDWDGGPVHYRLSDVPHQTELPALQGKFHGESHALTLEVFEKSSENLLFKTTFLPHTGEFQLSVTNRLLLLADTPWQVVGEEDAFAFIVSEQLTEPIK